MSNPSGNADDKSSADHHTRLLFEMQISGFYNDLPPPDNEGGKHDNSLIEGRSQRTKDEGKETGWAFFQLLGFKTSDATKRRSTFPPIWKYRYAAIIHSNKYD